RQRSQSGEQFGEILAGIRILQPEEHVVHDRRERCLAGGCGSGRAGAGGGHADSQGGGGEEDISAATIAHDPGPSIDGLRAREYRAISPMPQWRSSSSEQEWGRFIFSKSSKPNRKSESSFAWPQKRCSDPASCRSVT